MSWNPSTEGSVQWELRDPVGEERIGCVVYLVSNPPWWNVIVHYLINISGWRRQRIRTTRTSVVSLWLNGEMWFQCNNNNIIIRNCVNCCPHLHIIVLVRQLKSNTKTLDKCSHWGCEVVSLPIYLSLVAYLIHILWPLMISICNVYSILQIEGRETISWKCLYCADYVDCAKYELEI